MIDVRVPQKFQFGLKSAVTVVLAVGTVGVTAFWKISDERNDIRYVPRREYEQKQQALEQTLLRIEAGQEEARKDIKDLLKAQRHHREQ